MVGRRRRRTDSELLGNHQRCWLWGRHAVLETLRAGRWIPLEVHVDRASNSAQVTAEVTRCCQKFSCPLIDTTAAQRMTQLCRSQEHQGLLARMPPFPYVPLNAALAGISIANPAQPAFVVLLDGIQDPFNFGAILRAAEVFGVQAVIVPDKGQAEVSVHVVRSSAGAVNFIQLVQCSSLPEVAVRLKQLGIAVCGASEKGTALPSSCSLNRPVAIAIGNEGTGLCPQLLAQCDPLLSIPQSGQISSLNAAVAAGIMFYEVQRQRQSAVR